MKYWEVKKKKGSMKQKEKIVVKPNTTVAESTFQRNDNILREKLFSLRKVGEGGFLAQKRKAAGQSRMGEVQEDQEPNHSA